MGDQYTLPVCETVQAAVLQSNSFSEVGAGVTPRSAARSSIAADTVIYATGRVPLQVEVDALRFCAPEFHQIGDCWMPRTVQQATRMAFAVARDI